MNIVPGLELESIGPLWMELGALVATIAVFAYSVYATRHHALKVRIIVGILRFLLLGFGYFMLHHPTFVSRKVKPQERKMAILVDRSGSMASQSGENTSRYEKAYQLAQQLDKDGAAVEIFEFDQSISHRAGGDLTPGKLSGNKTDIYSSMNQFLAAESGFASVTLFSDGHDLGRFSHMSEEETADWLTRLKAPPINSVMVGDRFDGPEVAIHSIEAPSYSFVRAPLRIRATVMVRNLDGFQTQVQLLEGDKVIMPKDLVLDDQGFGTVDFEFYPEKTGVHLYTVLVPPHHLETRLENNKRQVMVEVGRDKISVLHISGSITWDLQGMRAMFERDNMVDLTAFYIMRTRDHLQIGTDNRQILPDEMALVPFPTEEIFDRQLFGFDVVVFQDFDAGNYFQDSYQANRLMHKIKEFVQDHHGGLIVIGGPRTAGGPSLGLTPVADILPLVPSLHRIPYNETPRKPQLTDLGETHPILRRFEQDLQTFSGTMDGLTLNKGARVLLRDQKNNPLLATMEPGTGRSLFLNTSSSWRWRRDALAAGKPGDNYYDFWEQALKWVIGDDSLNPVRIRVTRTANDPLTVDLDVTLRDQNFKAAAGSALTILAESLDDPALTTEVKMVTDSEGVGQAKFTAEKPGYYRMQIVEQPWKNLGRPEILFLGGSQDELRNVDPVPETLQRLAANSGGRFSIDQNLNRFEPRWGEVGRETIVETKRLKLRNWVYSLPILLLIAGIEWAVRRSRHLA